MVLVWSELWSKKSMSIGLMGLWYWLVFLWLLGLLVLVMILSLMRLRDIRLRVSFDIKFVKVIRLKYVVR